ncbi:sigma-70 family RNA polymerase sigma factor [Pandoraea pnomenusa]|uniref:sigma-70 family RNA polymerase sigma factor n=1 Tax=Pandoraea pnomenusa TaxID=93220 RepID=UPI0033400F34
MSASTRPRGLFAYYDELLRTWTGKLSNRHQAEDLAQDSLLRVLELETPPEQPRAYLHQTARNIAIDGYRRDSGREQTTLDALALHEATSGNPEEEVHAAQLALAIETALAELPLKCRQVFVWQRLDGLSQQEIADRLDLSKNMVEKYMIRAMKHLRERLGPLAPQ